LGNSGTSTGKHACCHAVQGESSPLLIQRGVAAGLGGCSNRLASGPATGVFGLMRRAQADTGNVSQAYCSLVREDGAFAIAKRTSSSSWNEIVSGQQSGAIQAGNATNHLRADCSGSGLALYVNGQKLLETSDAISGQARLVWR
jgi:hypothetical protein